MKLPDLKGIVEIFDRQLGLNSAAWYLQQALAAAVPFLILPWLLGKLGEAEIGVIIIFQTLVNYIILVADFGFTTTAVRFAALARGDRSQLSRLATVITGWRFGMALVLGAGAGSVVTLCFPGSGWVFWACMLQAAGMALNPTWLFLALEKIAVFSVMMVAARLLPIAAILWLVRGPEHNVLAALLLAAPFFLGGLPGWLYLMAVEKIRPCRPAAGDWRRVLAGGGRYYLGNLANSVYSLSPPLIVGALLGAEAAGVFGVMHRFITTLANIFLPFYQAVYPRICLALQDSLKKAQQLLEVIHNLSFAVTAVAGGALLYFSPLATGLLLDMAEPPIEYIDTFRLLAMIPLVMSQGAIWSLLTLVAGGHHGRYLRAMLITAAVAVPLGVGCTLAAGMCGTALATLITEVLAAGLLYWESRRYFQSRQRNKRLTTP